jgi:hypothetical protein
MFNKLTFDELLILGGTVCFAFLMMLIAYLRHLDVQVELAKIGADIHTTKEKVNQK